MGERDLHRPGDPFRIAPAAGCLDGVAGDAERPVADEVDVHVHARLIAPVEAVGEFRRIHPDLSERARRVALDER
nr:hypothetical protein [Microbacterium sp.]